MKRELAASQYRNEIMDFMWSTFRKVAGINNRKGSIDDDAVTKMDDEQQIPLAKFDREDY